VSGKVNVRLLGRRNSGIANEKRILQGKENAKENENESEKKNGIVTEEENSLASESSTVNKQGSSHASNFERRMVLQDACRT
jgi:phosphohistidine swiveling domain-containing protein